MSNYLLNSPVITSPGTYEYKIIKLNEMIVWMKTREWISTIGYPETASALTELTGITVQANRIEIKMSAGDEGLVDAVDTGKSKLIVHGVSNTKADGTEVPRAVDASNVQITKLNLADKRRVAKLGGAE